MNRKTFPILLLNFVNGVGMTLLIPVLPFIIRDLGYSDHHAVACREDRL